MLIKLNIYDSATGDKKDRKYIDLQPSALNFEERKTDFGSEYFSRNAKYEYVVFYDAEDDVYRTFTENLFTGEVEGLEDCADLEQAIMCLQDSHFEYVSDIMESFPFEAFYSEDYAE